MEDIILWMGISFIFNLKFGCALYVTFLSLNTRFTLHLFAIPHFIHRVINRLTPTVECNRFAFVYVLRGCISVSIHETNPCSSVSRYNLLFDNHTLNLNSSTSSSIKASPRILVDVVESASGIASPPLILGD
jgi:hypothetical protein